MKWVIPFVSFCAGSCVGILTMCCLIANRWDEKGRPYEEMEVTEFAGGDREQDGEPCDYDDEADGADGAFGGDDVSETPETGEGPEGK